MKRLTLHGARNDRLYFAQVREDARLEINALDPNADDSIVIVGSGGCTALSLLAAGAGRVTAVDLNRTQNHLIELKLAAVQTLSHAGALEFLGARPATWRARYAAYAHLRLGMSQAACRYWDARRSAIENGVLNAGVTETFIRTVVRALRAGAIGRSAIERLLSSTTIDEQRAAFDREWNTWRWRAFFRVLLNRAVFRRAYDPAFFDKVEKPSFATHFRSRAEYTLTQLAVRDNYFLHHMFTGEYPSSAPGGVPLYLDTASDGFARRSGELALVDGAMTEYLRTLPPESVSGFALSNIGEWLAPTQLDEMFAQVVRTARPGARVCFRNFVGWTEVPERWRHAVVEDRAAGESLMASDRSVVQRRFAVCRVHAGAAA